MKKGTGVVAAVVAVALAVTGCATMGQKAVEARDALKSFIHRADKTGIVETPQGRMVYEVERGVDYTQLRGLLRATTDQTPQAYILTLAHSSDTGILAVSDDWANFGKGATKNIDEVYDTAAAAQPPPLLDTPEKIVKMIMRKQDTRMANEGKPMLASVHDQLPEQWGSVLKYRVRFVHIPPGECDLLHKGDVVRFIQGNNLDDTTTREEALWIVAHMAQRGGVRWTPPRTITTELLQANPVLERTWHMAILIGQPEERQRLDNYINMTRDAYKEELEPKKDKYIKSAQNTPDFQRCYFDNYYTQALLRRVAFWSRTIGNNGVIDNDIMMLSKYRYCVGVERNGRSGGGVVKEAIYIYNEKVK